MTRLALIALMLLSTFDPANACEAIDRRIDLDELRTRKPIVGEEVRRTAMYGMRREGNVLKRQSGVDYEVLSETAVVAVLAGRVDKAQQFDQYGNAIVVDHGAGLKTLYAQLDGIAVRAGECVLAGQILGHAGTTDRTTHPKLHFEASDDGAFIYPLLPPRRQ